MTAVILIIHLLLALGIVGLVLLQRSEGGGLGIGGGGGGGMGGLVGSRSAASFLTRATGIAAGLFFVTSMVLSIVSGNGAADRSRSIITDGVPAAGDHGAPAPIQQEHQPTGPAVPLGE